MRNAQFALTQNYAALLAAVAARDYASQNLDAEQKKYSLGASTSTLVLQASSALTQAESNVLAAATNYEKSKVQLDLYTAATISQLGIDMQDAESGKVQEYAEGARGHSDKSSEPRAVGTETGNAAARSESADATTELTYPVRHAVLHGRHAFLFLPDGARG